MKTGISGVETGFTFTNGLGKTSIKDFGRGGGGGDELVNRSYRDRAADDLGHRDVTRNLSREL